ncbi:MAG: hypothetical protein Q9183_003358 [Haloplaca sp. 2 TL-2023]
MTIWIQALLDPTEVAKGSENVAKAISPPPKYVFTANEETHFPPPVLRAGTPSRSRGRPPRNGSPAKSDKAGSPRKKQTKAAKAENAENARAAAAALQESLHQDMNATSASTADGENVKLELDETTQVNGDVETTTTNVKVDLPGGMAADVPPQDKIQEMMREARAAVEEARELDGEASNTSKKRKAEELDEDSDEEADAQLQPAKKARLAEQELKKERVKNRALGGLAFVLAVG